MNRKPFFKLGYLLGAISIGAGAYFYFFNQKAPQPEEVSVQPIKDEASQEGQKRAAVSVASLPSDKPDAQMRSQIQSFARFNPEQRMDSYVKWVFELNQAQSKEDLERIVKAGLVGFMRLDTESKIKLRMNFCEALLNRNTPDAIRFVENTAKMNANNPNVMSILLKGIEPEGALERYPVLTSTATRWWNENKALRYDLSLKGFKSEDPVVMRGIEGSKFLTFDIDQIETQLSRIKAI